MLTDEQKKKMIEQRLAQYDQQIFSLEMDKTALLSVADDKGVQSIDERIEALRKARVAVEGMM